MQQSLVCVCLSSCLMLQRGRIHLPTSSTLHRRRGSCCIKKTKGFEGSPSSRLACVSLSTHRRPSLNRMILGRRRVWLGQTTRWRWTTKNHWDLEKEWQGMEIQWQLLKNISMFYPQDFGRYRKDFRAAILQSSRPIWVKCYLHKAGQSPSVLHRV